MTHSRIAALIIGCGVVVMGMFALITPEFESPDEPQHLDYVNYVAQTGKIPNQANAETRVHGEGHQPPLYYFLGAAIVRLTNSDNTIAYQTVHNAESNFFGGPSGAVPVFNHLKGSFFPTQSDRVAYYLLRCISVVAGFFTLLTVYKIGKAVFGDSVYSLVTLAVAATVPQFLFLSGGITNDGLAIMLATLTIYSCFKCVRQPGNVAHFIWTGIFLGLGLITKQTLIFLIPGVALAVVYVAGRVENRALFFKYVGIMVAAVVVLSGWMFVRNQIVYGDILAAGIYKNVLVPKGYHQIPLSYFIKDFWSPLIISFFANFGWLNHVFPIKVYALYAFELLIVFGGVVGYFANKKAKDILVFLSVVFILLCLAGIISFNFVDPQPQGRYLFPALGAISVLGAVGIKTVLERFDERFKLPALLIFFAILGTLPGYALVRSRQFYANPAYYREEVVLPTAK